MAVDDVNNDSTLLPGKTLRYVAHDIGKDSITSIAIKYKCRFVEIEQNEFQLLFYIEK